MQQFIAPCVVNWRRDHECSNSKSSVGRSGEWTGPCGRLQKPWVILPRPRATAGAPLSLLRFDCLQPPSQPMWRLRTGVAGGMPVHRERSREGGNAREDRAPASPSVAEKKGKGLTRASGHGFLFCPRDSCLTSGVSGARQHESNKRSCRSTESLLSWRPSELRKHLPGRVVGRFAAGFRVRPANAVDDRTQLRSCQARHHRRGRP